MSADRGRWSSRKLGRSDAKLAWRRLWLLGLFSIWPVLTGAGWPLRAIDDAPFVFGAGDPRIDADRFQVTVFARDLPYPLGMAELEDGSLLVGLSDPVGGSYFGSTGRLARLVDDNGDGRVDGPPTTLADGLPGALTAVRSVGDLVYAVSAQPSGSRIMVLRLGEEPGASLTLLGSIDLNYAQPMQHGTYGLAIEPGTAEEWSHNLYFNVGAAGNDFGGATVHLGGLASGKMIDSSIYRLRVDPSGPLPVFATPELIATGLRNAAGIALDPTTGDLWFEDNGIDTPAEPIVAFSADELNVIRAADLGGVPEDFGFPLTYVASNSGEEAGEGGEPPVVAFLPRAGNESEGAVEIAVLPEEFPAPLGGAIAVGFHGQWDSVGIENEENPLLAVVPESATVLPLVGNQEPAVGHLDGLLATADALYVADLTGVGSLAGTSGSGVIYRIVGE